MLFGEYCRTMHYKEKVLDGKILACFLAKCNPRRIELPTKNVKFTIVFVKTQRGLRLLRKHFLNLCDCQCEARPSLDPRWVTPTRSLTIHARRGTKNECRAMVYLRCHFHRNNRATRTLRTIHRNYVHVNAAECDRRNHARV